MGLRLALEAAWSISPFHKPSLVAHGAEYLGPGGPNLRENPWTYARVSVHI